MTRVVLDANVLVSGFPDSASVPGILIEFWLVRRFNLVISEHILDGISRAWNKDYFRFRFKEEQAATALELHRDRAMMVVPADTVRNVADDEEDDLVLATAIAGSADYLVTGDKGLLRIGSFEGVTILDPRAFLTILSE
jgi:putative PIN family toxin of toxin-antitoxin system